MDNQVRSLDNIITNRVARRVIFVSYTLAALGLGAVQVGIAATEAAFTPEWVNVANAVMLYLGIPVGTLAASNVPSDAVTVSEDPLIEA